MEFWLAPLHGITLHTFRNCLLRHITGIKTAISPFLPIQERAKLNVQKWKDILPQNNESIELIPQLIGNNADHFVDTVNALAELGYRRFNWNVGCPMMPIVRKKRGCGLMPFPEMIEEVVAAVTEQTPFKLSVKMRLGMRQVAESEEVIARLNRYDLDFIALHPRLGEQQYDGVPDLDSFAQRLRQSKHPLVYSGDIVDLDSFTNVVRRFPEVQCWMLGRGIIANPFLAESLSRRAPFTPENPNFVERFSNFYHDLIGELLAARGEGGALANLKELWHYFAKTFALSDESLKSLLRTNNFTDFVKKSEFFLTYQQ